MPDFAGFLACRSLLQINPQPSQLSCPFFFRSGKPDGNGRPSGLGGAATRVGWIVGATRENALPFRRHAVPSAWNVEALKQAPAL